MGENEGQNQPVKPQLGLFDAVCIMLGIVIGASIYKTPIAIFHFSSGPEWGLGVWALGGVLSLIGALCYAELASTYPRMGGDYVYLSRAFGPWAGFLFGWAQLSVVITASIGMMAFVFAENAVTILTAPPPEVLQAYRDAPADDWQAKWNVALALIDYTTDPAESLKVKAIWTTVLAVLAVLLLTAMNVLGVILGKWVQNLLSVVKVFGLGAIVYIGFSAIKPEAMTMAEPHNDVNFGLAMILVLYAFGGWNDMAFVAAEMRNPRNIPRALILGTAFITLIYLAVNAAYIFSLGFDEASNFAGPPIATRVLGKELGAFAGKGMAVLVMISALGAVNGLIFTGSRIYSSLGSEWSIFSPLGRWHPRYGSPVWSLLAQGVIALSMIIIVGTQFGRNSVDSSLAYLGKQLLPGSGLDRVALTDKGIDALRDIRVPEDIRSKLVPLKNKEFESVESFQEALGTALDQSQVEQYGTLIVDRTTKPMPWVKYEGGFDTLLAGTAPVFWLFFLLTGISLFALRQQDADIKRPFSVPLFPLLPLIFCTMCVYMLYSSLQWASMVSLLGFIPLAVGIPLYYLSGRTAPAPAVPPAPVEPPAAPKPEFFPFDQPNFASEPVQESAPAPEPPPPSEVPAQTPESGLS
jgi:amino acid transporter